MACDGLTYGAQQFCLAVRFAKDTYITGIIGLENVPVTRGEDTVAIQSLPHFFRYVHAVHRLIGAQIGKNEAYLWIELRKPQPIGKVTGQRHLITCVDQCLMEQIPDVEISFDN